MKKKVAGLALALCCLYSHAGADHKNLDAVVEKLLKGQGT